MSPVYSAGDRLEVEVVKIIPNGLGLAFAEELTLFVPLSAPGDRLRVEIAELKGRTAFAGIVEILEPSPERIEPPCPYFGTCGGCDFQQMSYEAQIAAKIGIIRDCLKRIARLGDEIEIGIIPCPEPFQYRIRTQVHADPQSKRIGFFKRQSHDVIEAESCAVLVPGLDGTVRRIRSTFDWPEDAEGTLSIEAGFSGGTASIYSEDMFEPVDELVFEAAGRTFSFDARSFFQANRHMIGPLIDAAVGGSSGALAIDLYCGIGLFTIPLAERFEKVIGVESAFESFRFAEANAAANSVSNADFIHSRVRNFLEEQKAAVEAADLVVVDPPRSGVKGRALELITDAAPKRITYVSCNPSTLARDIRSLLDSGYEIENFTALDLFPQTHHVEAVVRLKRAA
ncbi:MAG: class I SAM-dependent RNA methyltransferase [Acidobacteriota bacterium]|nr:MAG: class I SAM-dependent RNA methyltransferase [Acidobacteriota bacterium]